MTHQPARVEVARIVLIEVRGVDVAREGREQAEILAGQGPHQARRVSDPDLIEGAVDDEVIAHGVDPPAAKAAGWCQAGSMSRVFATSGARGDSGSEVSGPRLRIRDTTARALLVVGPGRQQFGEGPHRPLRVELHEQRLLGQQGVKPGLGDRGQPSPVLVQLADDQERSPVDGAALADRDDQHPRDRFGEPSALVVVVQGHARRGTLDGEHLGPGPGDRLGWPEGAQAGRAVGGPDRLLHATIAHVAVKVEGADDHRREPPLVLHEDVVLAGGPAILSGDGGEERQSQEERVKVRQHILADAERVQGALELRRNRGPQGADRRTGQRLVQPLGDLGDLLDGAEQRLPGASAGVQARMSSTVRVSNRTLYVSASASSVAAFLGRCSMIIS